MVVFMSEPNLAHKHILKYFQYAHLKQPLREISFPICEVAQHMMDLCKDSKDPIEVAVGLRKLLEAKDAFVRSMIP